MKINKASFLYVVLFLTLVTGNVVKSPAQNTEINSNKIDEQSNKSLLIKATLNSAKVNIGELIQLTLTIKNNSNYTIELFDPTPDRGFDIEVKNSKGINISLTKVGMRKKIQILLWVGKSLI